MSTENESTAFVGSFGSLSRELMAGMLDQSEDCVKILDPQGQAIQGALGALGFQGIESVRQGKVFDIELADGATADQHLAAMCERLLANIVIEDYRVEIAEGQ